MDSLSLASVRRLMDAFARIYSVSDLEVFGPEVFQAIGQLIPDAWMSLDKLSLRNGGVTHFASDNVLMPDHVKARVLELMATHPVMPVVKAGARGAIRVTDCMTQRQFRDTPHYKETLFPVGLKYQTVVTLDIPDHIAGFTVNRGKDFSDFEMTLLHLLAPHVALAYANLIRADALQKTLDSMPFPEPGQLQRIGLTRRESEVLYWIMQGKTDTEIAEIFSQDCTPVSPRTINNHVQNIFTTLKVGNRTSACLAALNRLKGSQ
jgi:DNA-binding CsgD family transcriptional regulator